MRHLPQLSHGCVGKRLPPNLLPVCEKSKRLYSYRKALHQTSREERQGGTDMSDILIKGMEMPSGCDDCYFCGEMRGLLARMAQTGGERT